MESDPGIDLYSLHSIVHFCGRNRVARTVCIIRQLMRSLYSTMTNPLPPEKNGAVKLPPEVNTTSCQSQLKAPPV